MDETTKAYYDLINRQQQANNEWSAQQAQKAMDYQTEMSNTAHQREVKDLIAAGLNPVLSAGGSGATTGSGIAASAGDANVTALYGLAKQAIDANMKQAEAMANQAKSVADASSGSGSGSGYAGKGFGSGPKRTDVEAYVNTVKSVWNSLFDGKNNEYIDTLDLSDMSKGGKLAICAVLHKLLPFLTTNQIYNIMEDYDIWNLPRSAYVGGISALIGSASNSMNSAGKVLSSAFYVVGNEVSNIIRNSSPKIAGASSPKIVGASGKKKKQKKETWFDRILSKRSSPTKN